MITKYDLRTDEQIAQELGALYDENPNSELSKTYDATAKQNNILASKVADELNTILAQAIILKPKEQSTSAKEAWNKFLENIRYTEQTLRAKEEKKL